MGNKGKWDSFYKGLVVPEPYIDTPTYYYGAEWLSECETVEDWGCGKGWFAHIAKELNVVSIDGSASPFADIVVDLESYTSNVEGIFMRAVAEHNYGWQKILNNLLKSFSKRAFVAFYTPMNTDSDEATLIMLSPGYDDVPELSIPTSVWHKMISIHGVEYTDFTIPSETAYGEETYYLLSK